jgi:hypothetical protein
MFEFLFGRRCVKVRRSKRDKRKKCKSKKCSVRSRRRSDLRKKCRSPRRISKKVKDLGGSAVEQAEAAAAVAAQSAESRGASPAEVVEVATQTALETATNAGATPMEVQQAVQVAEENARGATDDFSDLNLGGLVFGSRRTRFGSECSVLPRTSDGCTSYTVNGMFPCYLTATGCRKRVDKQPRQLIYVVGQTRSPVVRKVLQEEVRSREISTRTPEVPRRSLDEIDESEFGRGTTLGFGRCGIIRWRGADGKMKQMKKCRGFCRKHPNNPHCKKKCKTRPELCRKLKPKASPKKPPASLIKKCKKLKIKCTVKRGGKRRVYKSVLALKREIAKKMRKMKKR